MAAEDQEVPESSNGKKIAILVTVLLLLAVGLRLYVQIKRNRDGGGPDVRHEYAKSKLNPDDTVILHHEHPDSLKDERALIGKTIWVQAGDQLDYYPATLTHADYAHVAGTLPGAEPMLIKGVFEQVPPAGRAVARIAAGKRHVLLAFTLPKSANPTTLYATPVGDFEDGVYVFQTDNIFYYDDPHTLYKHWDSATWAHIDKHEVVPGMSENQVMMSIGEVMVPSSDKMGDRTVRYDNGGHPVKIVFENGKAVTITPQTP